MTGTCGGGRESLAEHGLDLTLALLVDGSYPMVGGLRERATWQHRLDLAVSFDPEPLLGWEGAEFDLIAYHKMGRPASYDVGDLQGVSNMDAPEETRIHEAFWTQRLPFQWLTTRIGLLDTNATFDRIEAGQEFLNSTVGLTPTIFDMPTYPQSAPGVEFTFEILSPIRMRLGLYETSNLEGLAPGRRPRRDLLRDMGIDDALAITEIEFAKRLWDRRFRIFGGAWMHDGRYFDLQGDTVKGGRGFYGALEVGVLAGEAGAELDAFVSYSVGDREVSAIFHHCLGGLTLRRFWSRRPHDSMGLMYSRALTNCRLESEIPLPESNLELYYRLRLSPWLSIQPDLQYIRHPAGQRDRRDAIVSLVRVELVF